jgi:hypothetical protein
MLSRLNAEDTFSYTYPTRTYLSLGLYLPRRKPTPQTFGPRECQWNPYHVCKTNAMKPTPISAMKVRTADSHQCRQIV